MSSGIDAEDVAVLCLIEADGDLALSRADLADLLDATAPLLYRVIGPIRVRQSSEGHPLS